MLFSSVVVSEPRRDSFLLSTLCLDFVAVTSRSSRISVLVESSPNADNEGNIPKMQRPHAVCFIKRPFTINARCWCRAETPRQKATPETFKVDRQFGQPTRRRSVGRRPGSHVP